ncbi:hypothetical protein ACNQFN_05000 [Thauera butanivorans]|uniref:hypothetical protein n=1 Tax=Thauera butanivorans TaxID=86174 RepID=UPI003AB5FDF1
MMTKDAFLTACIALAALAWATFQFLGQYAFVAMLLVVIALLLKNAGKPRFGGNERNDHEH